MATTTSERISMSDKNAVIREYTGLAPDYDRRWSFYIEATLRHTLRRLEVNSRENLLDVGCGTGALLEALATSVPDAKLSGVDPSSAMLDMARKRLGDAVVFKQGYAASLPFPNQAFDVVVSTNAFHYFRDPLGALEEMARVLRPAGRLVITDWCDDYVACRLCDLWLRVFNRAHFRTYGQKECAQLFEKAGLRRVRVERYKINWLWGLMTAVGQRHAAQQANAADRPSAGR